MQIGGFMGFIAKLISAIKDNATTTIIGLVGSLVVLLSDYGLGVTPSRKDWLIAVVLAALGLAAKDGSSEGGTPNA
jgi:uncharacterized membrane protein YeaQ/YmgE (transglycosylase-associated protein family)